MTRDKRNLLAGELAGNRIGLLGIAGIVADGQLELLAQRLKIEGVSTSIEVAEGHTAEAILDCAKHSHADLIAMTTHGRSGLGRWWLGSVADKVVRASHIPVLLVRPEEPA